MKITEDYVSFEVAKLLVQKGLMYSDTEYESYYTFKGEVVHIKDKPTVINVAPRLTIQMACKWLEIKHHIAIIPLLSSILDNEKFLWDVGIVIAETGEKYFQRWVYENRERACEAAIKYCLENLI